VYPDDRSAPARPLARVYGIAAILAPLLLLASTIAFITDGEGLNVGVLGGVVGVWSAFAFVIAFVGILRMLEPRAPRAAAIMTVLAMTGFASGVAFDVNAIFDEIVGPVELAAALDAAIDAGGTAGLSILAFLPWGFFGPVSMMVIGILLWRTRVTARWSAALLAVGGVLFVASRPERINLLALIADSVLVLALVPIGWSMLTGNDPARRGEPAVPTSG
jgi:uncharacterized membrane protein YgdD (TMEM256/DUF423 family)